MSETIDQNRSAATEEEKNREREQFKKIGVLTFLRNAREPFRGLDFVPGDIEEMLKTVEAKPEEFKDFVRTKGMFEFAVHHSGPTGSKRLDFDAQMVMWLLKQVRIDTSDTEYVKSGQKPSEDRICFDFGGELGVTFPGISSKSRTVIFDHHPKEDHPFRTNQEIADEFMTKTSTTELLFKVLEALELFDKKDVETIRKMIEFTTQMDNKTHPLQFDRKTFEESWQTIFGLYQSIPLDKLYELFAAGVKPTDKLCDDGDPTDTVWLKANGKKLNQLGLLYKPPKGEPVNRVAKRKNDIEKGLDKVREKAENGMVVEIKIGDKTLKFIVDYIADTDSEEESGIKLRVDSVITSGYAGVILYSEKTESYFINLDPRLEEELSLHTEDGVNVRGKMFIKNVNLPGPLKTSLSELLEKLGVDLNTAKDGLKMAIENNESWMKTKIEEIKGEDLKGMIERQGNYWVLPAHGDRKFGIIATSLPEDFKPEDGVIYQFRIYQDTEPGKLKEGALLYKLIGFPAKKEKKQPAVKTEQPKPREDREGKGRSREGLEGQEFYTYADEIRWWENRSEPAESHWSLPSKPDEGKKHGVIVKGLPEDFDPQKESRGTQVSFRIVKDTRPDSKDEGVFLLEVIGIERPAGNENPEVGQGDRQSEKEPDLRRVEKAETKEFMVPLLFDGDWKVVLPGGQEAKFSEEFSGQERDIRYLYKIKVEKREKDFIVVWVEKTDQLVEGESGSSEAHVDGDDKEVGRDKVGRSPEVGDLARGEKGNKRAKPWARRNGESEE